MPRFSLRLSDRVYREAKLWAERDSLSVNDWLTAAIEREGLRRRLDDHNAWVSDNPIYSEERWIAEQRDTDPAWESGDGRDAA